MNFLKEQLKKRKKQLLCVAGLLCLAVVILLSWEAGLPMVRLASDPEAFRQWIGQRSLSGQLVYILMVAAQVLAAVVPGEPLEIAGGYAFGAAEGTVLCLLGGALGSFLVIGLVRLFGQRFVGFFFSLEKLRSIRFLKSSPRRTMLFLLVFMIPGTPKDLLCYFVGLTDIKLPALMVICSLGRLPSIITSTIGGSALGTQRYILAVVVFALTFLLSGAGLLLYNRICTHHNRHHDGGEAP
ncbi:MAG: TVP38/TMEM64 family protein [Ruminiclostridium sp.]|nr:TVP38/TMEM64 family protein [Ruminiclostridium sp.]